MQHKNLAQLADQDEYWSKSLSYWEPVIIHSAVKDQYWDQIKSCFPTYQLFLFNDEDELIGLANTVPVYWDGDFQNLPERGWDWLVQTAIDQFKRRVEPNCLGGLQIIVFKPFRKSGWSSHILEEIKRRFYASALDHFILPIRPILKQDYPKIPMEIYMKWTMKSVPFDPWIRVHQRSGGNIIKICHQSMHVEGSKADWEHWTGIKIRGSGHYVMDGALVPLYYQREEDKGTYSEPNIWVHYEKQDTKID